jgi:NDP-sugar pyrophosphorylase family protein
MNGDVLTDLDFSEFYRKHEHNNELFTISAAQREHIVDYGVLERASDGTLSGFREKPRSTYLVSMGVYAMNRAAVEWVPDDQPFGFDQLMLALIAAGKKVRVEPHQGYWLDIGRPDDYHMAVADWPKLKAELGL